LSEKDDLELKMKLLRMQRRLLAEKAQKEEKPIVPARADSESIIRRVLRERGDEVLAAAKQQFPAETKKILEELATLVERGEVSEISGPWLYSVLNQVGIPVRLKTTIQIVSDGKVGSNADKLKEK
jgi:DNA-binding TFAR19-related protein (PDSD5 family)